MNGKPIGSGGGGGGSDVAAELAAIRKLVELQGKLLKDVGISSMRVLLNLF